MYRHLLCMVLGKYNLVYIMIYSWQLKYYKNDISLDSQDEMVILFVLKVHILNVLICMLMKAHEILKQIWCTNNTAIVSLKQLNTLQHISH